MAGCSCGSVPRVCREKGTHSPLGVPRGKKDGWGDIFHLQVTSYPTSMSGEGKVVGAWGWAGRRGVGRGG